METKRICIVLTTRGSYGKFRRLMELIHADPDLELCLATGGSLVLEDQVIPEFDLYGWERITSHFVLHGENPVAMGKSTGLAVSEFVTAFWTLKPDIVLVVGDRYETIAAVIAAACLNIVVGHLEGGEVSGSIDEGIRHACTQLAHVHFPCTDKSAERLRQMGQKNVFMVGSTSLDVLKNIKVNHDTLMDLQERSGSGPLIGTSKPFLLVIQHPVTTEYELAYDQAQETISAINSLKMPAIWICPNLDAGSDGIAKALREYRGTNPTFVHFFKGLPIEYFGMLLKATACVVGNSSAGIRECSFLGTPNVCVGNRQQGREFGDNTIIVRNMSFINAIIRNQTETTYAKWHLYGDGNASKRILSILKHEKFEVQKEFFESPKK